MRCIPLIVATCLSACGPREADLEDAQRAEQTAEHERQLEERIELIADSAYQAENVYQREQEGLEQSKYDLQVSVDRMERVWQIQAGRSQQEREEDLRSAAQRLEEARLLVRLSEERTIQAEQRAHEWRKKLHEVLDAE